MKKLTKILLTAAPIAAITFGLKFVATCCLDIPYDDKFFKSKDDAEKTETNTDDSDENLEEDLVYIDNPDTLTVDSLKEYTTEDGQKNFRCVVKNANGHRMYRPSVKINNRDDAIVFLTNRIEKRFPDADIIYNF